MPEQATLSSTLTARQTLWVRMMENAWLFALAGTPLFFNPLSSRIFEPEKTSFIRAFSILILFAMIVAWCAHGFRMHGRRPPRLRRRRIAPHTPPCVLAGLFLLVSLLSDVFSILPAVSLLGSYERQHGFITECALLIFFFSILFFCRDDTQREKMLLVPVCASVPYALYGILQHFQMDPIPWSGSQWRNVIGFSGNAVFSAATVMMLIPASAYFLFRVFCRLRGRLPAQARRILPGALLGYLILQIIAWGMGPIAGTTAIAVSVIGWVILACFLKGHFLECLALCCIHSILALQLVFLGVTSSRGPFIGLVTAMLLWLFLWLFLKMRFRCLCAVGLVGMLCVAGILGLNVRDRDAPLGGMRRHLGRMGRIFQDSGRVRILMWEGAVRIMLAHPGKLLIGHGAEVLPEVYDEHLTASLQLMHAEDTLPDRVHNDAFDTLLSRGIFGFLIRYALIFVVLYSGIKRITGFSRHWCAWTFGVSVAAAGMGAACLTRVLLHTWAFAGVAFNLGSIGGVFLYLVILSVYCMMRPVSLRGPVMHAPHSLPFALSTGLVAHLIEISVGFGVSTTLLLFWVYLGMLAGDCRHVDASDHPASSRSSAPSAMQMGCIMTFLLVTCFMGLRCASPEDMWTGGIVWLLVLSCLVAGCTLSLLLLSHLARGFLRRWVPVTACFVMPLAGVVFSVEWVLPPLMTRADPWHVALGYVILAGIAWCGALLAGCRQTVVPNRRSSLAALALLPVALYLFVHFAMSPVIADVWHRQSMDLAHREGKILDALEKGRQAVRLQPHQEYYENHMASLQYEAGNVFLERRGEFYRAAEGGFRRVVAKNPYHLEYVANLGRFYQYWGVRSRRPKDRRMRLEESLRCFDRALAINGDKIRILMDSSRTCFLLAEFDEAVRRSRKAMSMTHGRLDVALQSAHLHRALGNWERAVRLYKLALRYDPQAVWINVYLEYCCQRKGAMLEAAQYALSFPKGGPSEETTLRHVADAYRELGRYDQAMHYARRMLRHAQGRDRRSMEAWIEALQGEGRVQRNCRLLDRFSLYNAPMEPLCRLILLQAGASADSMAIGNFFRVTEQGLDWLMEQYPDNTVHKVHAADLCLLLGVRNAATPSEAAYFTRAKTLYTLVLQQHPGDLRAMMGLAEAWTMLGDARRAMEVLEPFVAQAGHTIPFLTVMGMCARRHGDVEAALGCYESILAIEPDHAGAAILSRWLDETPGHADRMPVFHDSGGRRPGAWTAYRDAALTCILIDRFEEASKYIVLAMRHAPDRERARLRYIREYIADGR